MALLDVKNVTRLYQAEGAPIAALQNVSLSVDSGEFVALVGRSGCGKSTLLNVSGAMDFPTSGDVVIAGRVTSGLKDSELTRLRREKVGFIFQSFQLLHTLTAIENVELPLLLARVPRAREKALDRLRWVEMDELAHRLPHQLSGGQQQRVAIARALAHDPPLLLADEPTGNLDSTTSEIILELLSRSAHQFGVAVVMATHSLESTACADTVVRMRDGRIAEILTAEQAKRSA